MAVSAASDSTAKSSSNFDSWYAGAKAKVMDFEMSDDDLIKYLGQQFQEAGKGGADSEAKRNALQQLVELRSRATSAMTNMLKTLMQTAQLVITNLRP